MSIGGAFSIIGIEAEGLYKSKAVSIGPVIDAQALQHYLRVTADGGVVPSGLSGVNAFFTTIKSIYATADITTAISAAYDPQYLGYKLGAGSGTTLGQAAQKLYSCSGASGDVVQTTAASQPLLLTHEGANYWQGPNVTNNAVSTPDAPANRITLDLEIIAYVKHTNNTTLNSLVSKNNGGNQRGYSLVFDANNLVLFYGLTTLNVASSTATIASGSTLWVRCTRNATTGQIQFFTSTNLPTTNPQSVTWTQLGSTISGIIGPINASGNLPLLIGGYISVNSGFASLEKIYRLTLSNSIGGAPVVDFNPALYNAATSQTQWTAATGEVWSINTGTATTGYKGVLVDRSIVQYDGQNARLLGSSSTVTNTITQNFGIAVVFSRYTTSTNDFIFNIGTDYASNNSAGLGCLTNPTPYLFTQGTALSLNNTSNSQVIPSLVSISSYANYGVSNGSRIFMNSIQTNFTINDTTNKPVFPISSFGICNSSFSNLNGCVNTLILSIDGTKFIEINNYIKSINNL